MLHAILYVIAAYLGVGALVALTDVVFLHSTLVDDIWSGLLTIAAWPYVVYAWLSKQIA